MSASPLNLKALPAELRELVKWSVALHGRVIERNTGRATFQRIEGLRKNLTKFRDDPKRDVLPFLKRNLRELGKISAEERLEIAKAFSLMLELMNACENAYRSYRLGLRGNGKRPEGTNAILYVVTAHPTEARSPENIAIFRSIQNILETVLRERNPSKYQDVLLHALELAWRIPPVREEAPQVSDEAEHIYEILFEKETFASVLEASREIVPVYFRTWVGGDKDGHPGVNEKVMRASLSLSRMYLLKKFRASLGKIESAAAKLGDPRLVRDLKSLVASLKKLERVQGGDGKNLTKLRISLNHFAIQYEKRVGVLHPDFKFLRSILHIFPGLVVPLELRESSDILMQSPREPKLVIDRMMKALAEISSGGDPRWYARGFIISMASTLEHVKTAEHKVRFALGEARIPVIPLFEELPSLESAPKVVEAMLKDREIQRDIHACWNETLEVMVGYSDSAKESGALPSRLAIARAMNKIDRVCRRGGVRPLFFHGSGGSVDRGGGTIQDQTAWWPRSALRTYKVTIQGEMVERSLAGPEIARGQILRIAESTEQALRKTATAPKNAVLTKFAEGVARAYEATVASPEFLELVHKATLYGELSELKFGSRPAQRKPLLSVKSLRAIPWALCWTQTRVLFPTWWGIGSAWRTLKPRERAELKRAFRSEPVFSSYVKALGFTLAKVEMPIWQLYLAESGLSREIVEQYAALFSEEFSGANDFLHALSGKKDPLWFRPWLGVSIKLRSPMIHPLNLLQIIAIHEEDYTLLRYTAAGISSGMLTTG